MKHLRSALAGLLALLAASNAVAQTQNLPANTVWGRLGIGTGPAQAIPFSQLGPTLITSNLLVTAPLSISGLTLSITGASGQILAGTPAAFTLTPTLGVSSSSTGSLAFATSAGSGKVTVQAPTTSTNWTFKFPTTAGSNGQALTTDGSGNTSWSAGAGTVNSGGVGQVAFYSSTGAAISGASTLTIAAGALTLGVSGSQPGTIAIAGSSSGAATLAAPASGGGTLTLPTGTDTIAAIAATQTFTNKTLTSPTINSATMTTPTLGVASATTVNKVAITAPATGSTLTIADGKTLTDTSGVGASVLLGATGGGFSAYAGATCTNQFVRSLTAAAAATCASVANTDLSNSSINIGSTNVALGGTASTVAGLTLTAPTINGGTAQALTNLGVRSSGSGAFDMVIANTENLTAQRALTLTLNNAARTISLSGNLTLGSDLITSGANPVTLTTVGSTNITLPTSGTIATLDTTQTFSSQKIFSALTQLSDVKFSSGKLYPTADSTTALQVTKADGLTAFTTFDSTNKRVGINKTPGSFDLDVNGAANVGTTLTFGTLDATSLGTSTSTVTGLTVNNSPSSANDYIPYYSAADGRIRKATVGSIAAGATAGVSSLNGLTGGLSIAQGNGTIVSAAGSSVTVSAAPPAPQGRLTLTSATPVMTSNVAGATTVYYTPYAGNSVPMYDGTNMTPIAVSEISQATTDATQSPLAVAASSCYDNFVWNPASPKLSRGPAWTNITTRSAGTALTMVNGILLNSIAITNGPGASRGTYVGTICSNASSTIDYIFGGSGAGGVAGVFNVWNAYNRVAVSTTVYDTTASWTYTFSVSPAYRAANNSSTARVTFARGLSIDGVSAAYATTATISATGVNAQTAIGLDSTTVAASGSNIIGGMASTVFVPVFISYADTPGLGQHYLTPLEEAGAAGSVSFFGNTNKYTSFTVNLTQ